MRPNADALSSYQSIFVGEVTGIRLTGYENKRLGRADVCDIEKNGEKGVCFNLTGGNEPVTIFALPVRVTHGTVQDVQELEQSGCNYPGLALKERGVFFVNAGGNSAVIVWESQKPDFTLWLKRLGVNEDGR
jgi:hypothetical protein